VEDLVYPNTHDWDESTIRNIFIPRDADLIMKIPLSNQQVHDKTIWGPEENGKFSVKSCYKSICGELSEEDTKDWSNIWQCKIPPKVKTFLWQACNSCLPTKDKLRQRHVNCDEKCCLCSNGCESILHLFVECDYARACGNFLQFHALNNTTVNFQSWMCNALEILSDQQFCTLAMVCWCLCDLRNNIIWKNQTMESARSLTIKARTFYSAWLAANTEVQSKQPTIGTQDRWRKPQQAS